MALILSSSIGLLKPRTAYSINTDNFITQDLWSMFLFNEAGGARCVDIAKLHRLNFESTASWCSSVGGYPGVRFNGTSDRLFSSEPTGNQSLSGAQPWSIAVICKSDSASSGAHSIYECGDGTVGSAIQVRRSLGDWETYTRQAAGNYAGAIFSGGVKTDRVQMVIVTWDNSFVRLYVDGLLRTSTALSGGKGFYGNNTYVGAGVGVQYWDGTIDYLATWNRALVPDEVMELWLHPYSLVLTTDFVPWLDTGAALAYTQEGFRWREDDGSETTATWLAAQDTNINRDKEVTTRLRLLTDTSGGDPPSEGVKLQYRPAGDPGWLDVT